MWAASVNWMAEGTSVLSEPAGRSSVGFVNAAILIRRCVEVRRKKSFRCAPKSIEKTCLRFVRCGVRLQADLWHGSKRAVHRHSSPYLHPAGSNTSADDEACASSEFPTSSCDKNNDAPAF